ncbi:MAG: hypothetical protein Q9216_001521 [Gyalolechia sp. 2 TL-2023]
MEDLTQMTVSDTSIYEQLTRQDIRLLTLLPGCLESSIRVRLDLKILDQKRPPQYEALSYTWGSPTLSHRLEVDLGHRTQILPITENLHIALRYLRHDTLARTLWVDAICINQGDIKERNQQVRRMAEIYTLAEKVIVWLGPDADGSSLAMEALDSLASKISVDWNHYSIRPASAQDLGSDWLDLDTHAPFSDQIYFALVSLLNRPWFGRLWIWQEVFLAGGRAEVLCGATTLTWEAFRKAILCFYRRRKPRTIPGFYPAISRAWQISNMDDQPSLRTVLRRTKDAKCTDQRDRIYGVLQLVGEAERYEIEPDYNKSVADVFGEPLIKGIFEQWNMTLLTCYRSTVLNSGDRLPERKDTYAALRRLSSIMRKDLHIDFERQAEKICRTLCLNEFADRYEPVNDKHVDFKTTVIRLLKLTDPLMEVPDEYLIESVGFLDAFLKNTIGRAIISTEEGHFGLAPKNCQEGDCIAILLSCQSPMILRPEPPGEFLVIGECYIHDFMDGEAFLGPFPKDWQRVFRYDEATQSTRDAFIDRDRDICQIEDPRLGPLPEGWFVQEHSMQHLFTRYGDSTRGFASIFDPRMMSTALRRRGIELKEFKLV